MGMMGVGASISSFSGDGRISVGGMDGVTSRSSVGGEGPLVFL